MRNVARSTLRWKGCLLTALAVIVLLASSGTASAQITITGPAKDTVMEGDDITYTVNVRGTVPPNAVGSTFTLTLATPTPVEGTDGSPTIGEAGDIASQGGTTNFGTVTLTVDANTGTTVKSFSKSGTLSGRTLHDDDAEDERFTLAFNVDAAGGLQVNGVDLGTGQLSSGVPSQLIIDDDEDQTYKLALAPNQTGANAPNEGGAAIMVNLTADPELEDSTTEFQIHLADAVPTLATLGDLDTQARTITEEAATVVIVVNPGLNDGNRVSDVVTVEAYSGVAGSSTLQASLDITITDDHALPMIKAMVVDDKGKALDPQPEYVEEGKSVMIAAMSVDKDGKPKSAGEDLKVMLEPTGTADARDYRLSSSTLEIGSGKNMSDPVTLMAVTDEDVGMETLMFDATVSGEKANGEETAMSMGALMLDIMDATEKMIAPKPEDEAYPAIEAAMEAGAGEEGLNPGEMFELMTSDLFTVTDGYTASYSASVEGNAISVSVSGEEVTVMAERAGMAKLTITGTARMASSSFMPDQTTSNVASIMFEVTVELKDLVIMLHGPEDMNLVEGMSYEVKAMANRPVEMDTMVEMVQTDGTAAPADYEVESITIMKGEDMGMTMLMVADDGMMENDGNMAEMLTLEGRYADDMDGDTKKTNALSFYLWDAAVPALPIIAQLLLAAFLAIGGYRRYLRR